MSSANDKLIQHLSAQTSCNALKERNQNMLNVQVQDFLNKDKSRIQPESCDFRHFRRTMQLQKEILNENDRVHSYQTQLFFQQLKMPTANTIQSKRPSTQHFRPTLTNEYALPQKIKKPQCTTSKQIQRIDDDLLILAQMFRARHIYRALFTAIREGNSKNKQKARMHHRKCIFKAFLNQMNKKVMIKRFKRSLKL